MSRVARFSGSGLAVALSFAIALTPRSSRGEDATLGEEIIVTGTRSPRPLLETPAQVTVVSEEQIERSAGKTVDEILSSVPVFNSFRRSSSVQADPSSTGMTLRGVAPGAASRSLVLVDGVPANDAFADNIWWRAIPPLGIQRIEIVPGGGSALYGNYALGGVMQILSRPITPLTLDAVGDYGSFNTGRVSAWASDRWGPVGAALEGDLFTSDGYFVVAPYARGPVDAKAPSKHAVGSGRMEVIAADDLVLTATGNFFYENYNGGTQFTTAAIRRWEFSAGARYSPSDVGTFILALSGHVRDFFQSRARVNADRSQEVLNGKQFVPAQDLGVSLLWRSQPLSLGGEHNLVVGIDSRWIKGESQESLFPATVTATSVVQRNVGGNQQLYGVFAEDVYDVSKVVQVVAALRYDFWQNTNGSRYLQLGDLSTSTTDYPNRNASQVDPKVGVNVRPLDWLTLHAAGYHSFRAPTLDELYRSFQVGTILTNGNPALSAETLWGAEVGFTVSAPKGFTLGVTGFWNEMYDPIANVTIGTNLREKQNLGQARIRGIEASAAWRFAPFWSVAGSYVFVDARVTEAPAAPQLVGNQLIQDPRNRANLTLAYDNPSLVTVSAEGNYIGMQYENDINTLPMGEVYLVNVFAAWHATKFLDVYVAVQNLFDRLYVVGRAGIDTVGQPRFIHGGVRLAFGG
ncbi:MAG: TonB-dependent receptor [Deltaproteobacteria bacterium]|nr:TonB-dependent receptor [Deltaproteobacteria bacterium]